MRFPEFDNLTIVIVTYKGDALLRGCLDSLRDAGVFGDTRGRRGSAKVVVVDNSPSAATRSLAGSYGEAVEYVVSPGNPGFAGGNNRAVPFCNRKYVLLLNNDTVVRHAESIAALVEFLDAHPRCGVAGGTGVLPKSGGAVCGCGAFLSPLGNVWSYAQSRNPPPDETHTKPCFAVGGFFLMFRREILARTRGLFHPNFWCYYEEIDFCHRVWMAGFEVWYVESPPIEHLMGETAGRFERNRVMRRYLRNILFSFQVNLSFLSRLWLVNSFRALILMRGFCHLFRGNGGFAAFKSHVGAIADSLGDRRRILAARRRLSRTRARGDFAIFRRVMRPQPFSLIRSSLGI